MLRHSLNSFLRELKKRCPKDGDREKINKAEQYLNRPDFHKQLRNGFKVLIINNDALLALSSRFLKSYNLIFKNPSQERINNDNCSKA